jgi:hypothetical protein
MSCNIFIFLVHYSATLNINQPDLQLNDGTGEEILLPTGLPALPPTLPPMDTLLGDAGPVNKQLIPSDIPI